MNTQKQLSKKFIGLLIDLDRTILVKQTPLCISVVTDYKDQGEISNVTFYPKHTVIMLVGGEEITIKHFQLSQLTIRNGNINHLGKRNGIARTHSLDCHHRNPIYRQ